MIILFGVGIVNKFRYEAPKYLTWTSALQLHGYYMDKFSKFLSVNVPIQYNHVNARDCLFTHCTSYSYLIWLDA